MKKHSSLLFFCVPSQLLDSFLSLSPGAFVVVLAAGAHSQGDEGRDHPEAARTQLWSNREHQQLPQPVCAAAHKCQVGWIALLCLSLHVIKVIFCSRLSAWLLLLHHSPLVFLCPLLSTCTHIFSASHLLIPFHCPSQIQFRVNPPPLCSEVTLTNDEESMSSVLDGTLYIGKTHANPG